MSFRMHKIDSVVGKCKICRSIKYRTCTADLDSSVTYLSVQLIERRFDVHVQDNTQIYLVTIIH